MTAPGNIIFLVDDSPIVQTRLITAIEGLPAIAGIRTAGSYAGALELLSKEEPNIVLLDIHLPDRSGIELLRYIHRYHPSVSVVMLSNEATEHYRLVCRMLGAVHFIDKSIEFDKLPAILTSLIL